MWNVNVQVYSAVVFLQQWINHTYVGKILNYESYILHFVGVVLNNIIVNLL